MDSDGDIVMGDVRFEQTQPSLADYIMPFGKFQGEKLCEVPSWYLHWLPNITDPTPTFAAALTYALAATSFTEMEIDWYPPPISAAPDDFHQYEKIKKEGKPKSPYTALWITKTNTMKYFYVSDEILRVMGVEKLPNEDPSETNMWKSPKYGSPEKKYAPTARYSLYHIWSLAQVYMTKGEADFVLRKYKNEVLRKDVQGSPRKLGTGFH